MNTKPKGGIAEQAAILQALKREWKVLALLVHVFPVEVFIS